MLGGDHPLALKVMRLAPPSVPLVSPLTIVEREVWFSDAKQISVIPGEGINSPLLLPVEQEALFVGQTFKAYVDLTNTPQSQVSVTDVVLLVELAFNNGAETVTLFDSKNSAKFNESPTLRTRVSAVVAHQCVVPGNYVLLCTTTYATADTQQGNGRNSMRRSFKFIVSYPLTLNHRVAHLDGKAIVETAVENVTPDGSALRVLSLDICPTSVLTVERVGEGVPQCLILRAHDTFAVVHVFRSLLDDVKTVEVADLLGHFRIKYVTVPTGEPGLIEKIPLHAQPISRLPPLELRVLDCPAVVEVEMPFAVVLEIVNRNEDDECSLNLKIARESLAPLYVNGATSTRLGTVAKRSSVQLPVTVMAIVPGFHPLRGFTIFDDKLGKVVAETDYLGIVCAL